MTPPFAFLILLVPVLMAFALPTAAQTSGAGIQMPIQADVARRQISVVVNPGLTQTAKLPTPELRQARKDMLADLDIPVDTLRALAERRDGLAAQKYVRFLVAQGQANPSDVAYFGTLAVSAGRVWSMPDVVAALRLLDPASEPKERVAEYAAMLYPHAWAGNSLALDALIELNGAGKLFGPMSEETRQKILARGDEDGDGRAALQLALVALQKPDRTPEENALLADYLGRAALASDLAIRTTAINLRTLQQGSATVAAPSQ